MPSYPIPSCPATITPPNANGFGLEQKKHKVGMRTEMGSTRYRVMNTSNIYVINCEFSFFTTERFVEFLTWLKYETNYGNLWFKADWFDEIGFDAGEWIFKFVELPFSNTGYSQKHNATLLMGPYNDNVVSGDYTEVGVGGEFIDDDFPFGWEEFQGELLQFSYLFAYFDEGASTNTIYPLAFNGTNNYQIAPFYDTVLDNSNHPVLVCLTNSRIVFFSRNTTAGPTIKHLKINVADMAEGVISSVTSDDLLSHATIDYVIDACTISDDEIAVCYMPDPSITIQPSAQLERRIYTGGVWNLVGSAKTISFGFDSNFPVSICSLSEDRVVAVFRISGDAFVHIQAYDWNGSTYIEVGSAFTTAISNLDALQRKSIIQCMSSNEIILREHNNSKVHRFSFNETAWSSVSSSTIGAFDSFCVIGEDKFVGVIGNGLEDEFRIYNYTGGLFVLENTQLLHDYASTQKSINNLPIWMVQ